jgi:hypothetical protein
MHAGLAQVLRDVAVAARRHLLVALSCGVVCVRGSLVGVRGALMRLKGTAPRLISPLLGTLDVLRGRSGEHILVDQLAVARFQLRGALPQLIDAGTRPRELVITCSHPSIYPPEAGWPQVRGKRRNSSDEDVMAGYGGGKPDSHSGGTCLTGITQTAESATRTRHGVT